MYNTKKMTNILDFLFEEKKLNNILLNTFN